MLTLNFDEFCSGLDEILSETNLSNVFKFKGENTNIYCWTNGEPSNEINGEPSNEMRKMSSIICDMFRCEMIEMSFDVNKIEVGPILSANTSPWGSNAKSILEKCGVNNIKRIECSRVYDKEHFDESEMLDKMTEMIYTLESFKYVSEPLQQSPNIVEGVEGVSVEEANKILDLNFDEQDLQFYSVLFQDKLKRNPTEMELLDLAQSNSEHSRHWVFKGKMIHPSLGVLPDSLFKMVKNTLYNLENVEKKSDRSVLAFCDNSSAIKGFDVDTITVDINNRNMYRPFKSKHHITFTAETHNFPTGIAPFQGATTGTGGRIRDNQSIGRGGLTIAGTAGYCVGEIDPNLSEYSKKNLYTLLKASDGASDYGNKFGEPLINGFCRIFGSTFKRDKDDKRIEWVKPIMFSGGIGQMLGNILILPSCLN